MPGRATGLVDPDRRYRLIVGKARQTSKAPLKRDAPRKLARPSQARSGHGPPRPMLVGLSPFARTKHHRCPMPLPARRDIPSLCLMSVVHPSPTCTHHVPHVTHACEHQGACSSMSLQDPCQKHPSEHSPTMKPTCWLVRGCARGGGTPLGGGARADGTFTSRRGALFQGGGGQGGPKARGASACGPVGEREEARGVGETRHEGRANVTSPIARPRASLLT